ncbi:M12 family metallo-peptidase [Spartinivicinus poritis]|uniref:M12 family metallo-peptidase n=1 Tax=Spartinivicinus poritis TaxID=2994640 RepID=A0ABT5UB23_9GAMM|nr:M12 family metallo-peptidase [Spartinivicinus sp. A2-2]MDE1463380.1 M12 family metallo-peptidase [Spartinivicinus sp. A2-2]
MLKKIFSVSCLSMAVSSAYAIETIDVAILYTPEAEQNIGNVSRWKDDKNKRGNIKLYIDYIVNHANLILENSQTNLRVRALPIKDPVIKGISNREFLKRSCINIVRDYQGNETQQDIEGCRDTSLNWLKENSRVQEIKKKYGADLVSVIVDKSWGTCGLGNLAHYKYSRRSGNRWVPDTSSGLNSNATYSWIGSRCSADALIHEIGHNLGLSHGFRRRDGSIETGTIVDSARGYRVPGQFATIMSYTGQNTPHVNYFSSPYLKAQLKTGGYVTPSDGIANSVQGIKTVANEIANFMPTVVTVGEPTPKPTEPKQPPVQPTPPKKPKPKPPVTTRPATPVDDDPVNFPDQPPATPEPKPPTSKPKPPSKPVPPVTNNPVPPTAKPPVNPAPVPPISKPENPSKPTTCTVKLRLPFSLNKWFPMSGFNSFGGGYMNSVSVEGENCQSILNSINSIWGLFKGMIYKISGNNWYKGISQDITQQLRPNQSLRFSAQMAINSMQSMRRWGVAMLKMEYGNGKPTTYRRVAQRSLTSGYFSKISGKVRVSDEEYVGLQKASLVFMTPNNNQGFYFRQGRIRN